MMFLILFSILFSSTTAYHHHHHQHLLQQRNLRPPTRARSRLYADVVASPVRKQADAVEKEPLLEKLEHLEGIWFSDDFYGIHGREWVEVSATLEDSGRRCLQAIKASGDPFVPAGYLTWRTRCLPDVGGGEVPAEIQVRQNIRDPNGFAWIKGSLSQTSFDQIQVTMFYSSNTRHTGTFHKHQVGEGCA